MANWWENLTQGASTAGSNAANALGKFGYDAGMQALKLAGGVARTNPLTQVPANLIDNGYLGFQALSGGKVPQGSLASRLQGLAGMTPKAVSSASGRFGGPDKFAGAGSGAPAGPTSEQMQADMLASLLGELFPSGGGPNLSGYDTMLGDITSRETALGGRRDEQQAYIDGIIAASRGRTQALQDGVAGRVEGQLDSDAVRRLAEQNAIRNQDSARLAVTNQAREALGVAPAAADLTSGEAQSAIGSNFGAGLSADSDARMRESIQTQQYARQLAGLDPMQAQYGMTLNNNYEDRLGALASERAQIQAQRAQAAASYSPKTPSVSEYLALADYVGGQFGGGEAVELPGLGGITERYSPYSSKAEQISNAAATFLSSPAIQNQIKANGKLDKATMMSLISNSYPELFQGDQYAVGQLSEVIDYLTQKQN